MDCVRCGHSKDEHERDAVSVIRSCRLCDCDKFGITHCRDCGKWVGKYLVSGLCKHCYYRRWWSPEGVAIRRARQAIYDAESRVKQESREQQKWLRNGKRTLSTLRQALKYPEVLQSLRQESQPERT